MVSLLLALTSFNTLQHAQISLRRAWHGGLLTHRREDSPFSLSAYFDPFFEGQILGPTSLLWNKSESPFLCCVIAACACVGWFG